jgi:hypothetical protein
VAAAAWIESLDVPPRPTPQDARAFFGVPPDPEAKLDANISRKRRSWRSKTRERRVSENAARKVEAALKLIDILATFVKRGVLEELDLERLRESFVEAPETVVGELDDLWRIVEELVASGRLDEALRVANEARERFAGTPTANAVFGWLAAQASRRGAETTDVLRREGLAAIREAIGAGERNADTYMAQAVLQIDLQDGEGALATLREAQDAISGGLTPWMSSHKCEAHALLGQTPDAISSALVAVTDETTDLALRSNTANALVHLVRHSILPIASRQELALYRDVVDVAAWCASGAPEAEDFVRPYRLWATEAGSRVYAGRLELRTIGAVLTGFLLLPALNRWRSKPQWRIFRDGPGSIPPEIFELVALRDVPLYVHGDAMAKLGWRPDEFVRAGGGG